MNHLNICFFASSEFVIPILTSVYESTNVPIKLIFDQQLSWLEENRSILTGVYPENLLESLKSLDSNSDFFQKTINLKMVVTQPDRLNRDKTISNPVAIFCKDNSIPTFKPEKINLEIDEFSSIIENFDIGITASFGQIVSQKVLDLAKYGFINWHPSLLPKYRGPTPLQTAILNNDKEIGLSWIEMTKKMDAGQIYMQLKYNLEINENFTDTINKMSLLGSNTWLLVAINKIFSRTSIFQNEDEVTFTRLLTKEDKFVDPKKSTAQEIYNHFKAYIQTPFTVYLDDYFTGEVKILSCSPFSWDEKSNPVINFENETWIQLKKNKSTVNLLRCANNSLLQINIIQLANGKRVHLADYKFRTA